MQKEKTPTIIIIGAGLGGLAFYHALIKNKDKKEFNVKIFERESAPTDRWQGYHIGLSNHGIRSLMNCIPSSIASNLPKAIPNPIPDVEYHGILITDHQGDQLLKPPLKQFKDVYEIAKMSNNSSAVTYRDRLRDVLLENVSVQWGKKFIRYEETQEGVFVLFEDGSQEFCDILVGADGINSPVRKQKIPELQIFDFGLTQVLSDIAVPKHLMDKLIKIRGNTLVWKTIGPQGDSTLVVTRLIPIEQEQDYNNDDESDSNEPCYRTSLIYYYPTKLYDENVESGKVRVDDNDPASVVEHVKQMIRKLRPECEVTNVILELWDLVPTTPNDSKNFPFKTYNPVQRRRIQDVNPASVDSWKSSRVTLLGDAAHAMSPILALGANNAIQDADFLSQALLNFTENHVSCVKDYEYQMLKRSSADVLNSRFVTLKLSLSVGYFGTIIRNSIMKIINVIMRIYFNY